MQPKKSPITSLRNRRVVEARKLTQRKHRVRQDRFLVEGLQLLAMAVERIDAGDAARIQPLEVFYSEEDFVGEAAPRLLNRLAAEGADAIAVAPHVLETLSEREQSQGLAGTFALHRLEATLEDIGATIGPAPALVLVLDRLQDPGNLGTLIRTADAVGARGVILFEPCADPFDPKTVRGTMGSIFNVPLVRLDEAEALWPWLQRSGLQTVGADAGAGETVWEGRSLAGSTALFLGNEARGLSADLRRGLTDFVALPLLGKAESLNVAVAGGVLMYEWLRTNRSQDAPRARRTPEDDRAGWKEES